MGTGHRRQVAACVRKWARKLGGFRRDVSEVHEPYALFVDGTLIIWKPEAIATHVGYAWRPVDKAIASCAEEVSRFVGSGSLKSMVRGCLDVDPSVIHGFRPFYYRLLDSAMLAHAWTLLRGEEAGSHVDVPHVGAGDPGVMMKWCADELRSRGLMRRKRRGMD